MLCSWPFHLVFLYVSATYINNPNRDPLAKSFNIFFLIRLSKDIVFFKVLPVKIDASGLRACIGICSIDSDLELQ